MTKTNICLVCGKGKSIEELIFMGEGWVHKNCDAALKFKGQKYNDPIIYIGKDK